MNREEIEAEAYRRFPIERANFEMMQHSDMMRDCFLNGAEWMQDKCSDKISELTEQLDASHVFCEGVNERFIKKAYKWFCDNALNYIEYNEWDGYNVNYSELEKDFKQAMKGE